MLKDKVAIITGAANGLGKAAAKLFAKNEATVVVADKELEQALKVVQEIRGEGGESFALKLDVTNPASCRELAYHVNHIYGRIDILINNAGIVDDKTFLKMTYEQWLKVINVNLTGIFNVTKEIAPIMKAQGYGKIINTSSIVRDGNIGQANYSATKAGLVGLTKTLAKELGRYNINVNAVAFGFMLTDMTKTMPPERLQAMADQVPLGRLGTEMDAAKAYMILASELSDYISGECLRVDGGLRI